MKICVFTGGRAEYGLLKPLLKLLASDNDITLQILVAGMHLCPEFGSTYKIIEEDGFFIDEKVEMILSSDSPVSICKSMGLGLISFSEALARLKPDTLVTLGDRFENFAVSSAAWTLRIPIAHIQGGEITAGAIDDGFRHCITKLSSLHFTATEEYRNRVIQLGEQPSSVFNVGAINVESLKKTEILDKDLLEKELNFKINRSTILVTFHPATLDKTSSDIYFKHVLDAIDADNSLRVIFTKTLADTDGRVINTMIDEYVAKNSDRCMASISLGQLKYVSALNYIGAVVGNSSSGIIETASVPVATVNIGDREKGRICPDNVINSENSIEGISDALRQALSPEFQSKVQAVVNPYEKEGTARLIFNELSSFYKDHGSKEFFDIIP